MTAREHLVLRGLAVAVLVLLHYLPRAEKVAAQDGHSGSRAGTGALVAVATP
jgi:hypothetical protein